MRAALLREFAQPLVIEEIPTPQPGPGQVVVYVLMDLRRRGYFVREAVQRIEQAVVRQTQATQELQTTTNQVLLLLVGKPREIAPTPLPSK